MDDFYFLCQNPIFFKSPKLVHGFIKTDVYVYVHVHVVMMFRQRKWKSAVFCRLYVPKVRSKNESDNMPGISDGDNEVGVAYIWQEN